MITHYPNPLLLTHTTHWLSTRILEKLLSGNFFFSLFATHKSLIISRVIMLNYLLSHGRFCVVKKWSVKCCVKRVFLQRQCYMVPCWWQNHNLDGMAIILVLHSVHWILHALLHMSLSTCSESGTLSKAKWFVACVYLRNRPMIISVFCKFCQHMCSTETGMLYDTIFFQNRMVHGVPFLTGTWPVPSCKRSFFFFLLI